MILAGPGVLRLTRYKTATQSSLFQTQQLNYSATKLMKHTPVLHSLCISLNNWPSYKVLGLPCLELPDRMFHCLTSQVLHILQYILLLSPFSIPVPQHKDKQCSTADSQQNTYQLWENMHFQDSGSHIFQAHLFHSCCCLLTNSSYVQGQLSLQQDTSKP